MTDNNNLVKFANSSALTAWLEQQTKDTDIKFFLAHHDDGVVWGKIENGKLTIAADVFKNTPEVQTQLNPVTLRQARLFGETAELLLWRLDDGSFQHRLLDESGLVDDDVLTETYLLWGEGMKVDGLVSHAGFTLMHEGKQGLRHAPPLPDAINKRGGLIVKHHLEYDDKGQAYIARSRLAGLEIIQEAKNGT